MTAALSTQPQAARWPVILLAFVGGTMSAVQSRVNGQLALEVGSGLEAAFFSLASGLLVVFVIALTRPSIRRGVKRVGAAVRARELAWWQVLGGFLGAYFIAVQSATVPVLGVAIFMVAIVAGQSGNSLVVDRLGLGPAGVQSISPARLTSAVLAVVAVIVAVSGRLVGSDPAILPLLFALSAGILVAVQSAINGRVARAADNALSATLLNFLLGSVALGLIFGVVVAARGTTPGALLGAPWWAYLGGVIGVFFVVIAVWAVPRIGVLIFTLASIAGQLFGALGLDISIPTPGSQVTTELVLGVMIAFIAVVIAARTALTAEGARGPLCKNRSHDGDNP